MTQAARGERVHIGVFGRRNAGKSSLVNALTGQRAALVSEVAGTTTDPVYQPMELHGAGAVVFIDTAGFDDTGELGGLRVGRTREASARAEIGLVLFEDEDMDALNATDGAEDNAFFWAKQLLASGVSVFPVVSKGDLRAETGAAMAEKIKAQLNLPVYCVSAATGEGVETLREARVRRIAQGEERSLLA